MTEIIRTEGVVLRRRDFSESSRIAVVYTRARGKVQLLAKGARQPKSKFGASLEPLTRGDFVFYWRDSKELFTLSEASPVLPARYIRENAAALPYALAVAEAVEKLNADEDADPALYDLLAAVVAAFDAGGPPLALLTRFLISLAERLGISSALERCATCGRPRGPEGLVFLFAEGHATCAACAPPLGEKTTVSAAACAYYAGLTRLPITNLERISVPDDVARESLSVIRRHLRYRTGVDLRSLHLV